jgi:hypothetical protein
VIPEIPEFRNDSMFFSSDYSEIGTSFNLKFLKLEKSETKNFKKSVLISG